MATKEEIRNRLQTQLDNNTLPPSKPELEVIIDFFVGEIATLHEIIEEQDEKLKELEDTLFPRGVNQESGF